MTLYQDCSSNRDSSKTWLPGGRGLFSLYIYIENFKNLLVRYHWTDFKITWQECSFCNPLPRFSSCHDSPKNMSARGRGIFSLYIYIENFRNLLVRNHRTDFNITWQECFIGDPLLRLIKQSWFIKKHGRQGVRGGEAYFSLYIFI